MKPQHLLIVLFGGALYWMYRLYEPFLLTMLIAALLAISTANIQCYFTNITKSRFFGSMLSTFLLALLFFAPLGYFLASFSIQLNNIDPAIITQVENSMQNLLDNPPASLLFLKPYVDNMIQDFQSGATLFHASLQRKDHGNSDSPEKTRGN